MSYALGKEPIKLLKTVISCAEYDIMLIVLYYLKRGYSAIAKIILIILYKHRASTKVLKNKNKLINYRLTFVSRGFPLRSFAYNLHSSVSLALKTAQYTKNRIIIIIIIIIIVIIIIIIYK